MDNSLGCFFDPDVSIDGALSGPLSGRTFAVKDLYDIAGRVSNCGNPDWGRTHKPAAGNAPCVDALLAAGASVRGKTHTDELAYSINGENHHYGTPVNANAPGRIPGGSSSGSASAVSGGLVDFALGTDTGGSVRIPASFCGIFGLRPTHDRIALQGLMPLAPTFDTIGWFARDPALMRDVGRTLLPDADDAPAAPTRLLCPEDAWALASEETRAALAPAVAAMEAAYGPAERMVLVPEGISRWFKPFRVAQGFEIWQQHRDWIEETKPFFGPGIAERFQWVATLTQADKDEAEAVRAEIEERLASITAGGAVLLMPIAPGAAPPVGRTAEELEQFRYRVLQLSGIAPLAKTPQISLPVAKVDGFPVALSVMAGRGGDELLLRIAADRCGISEGGLAAIHA